MKRNLLICIISVSLILLSASCGRNRKAKVQTDKTIDQTTNTTAARSDAQQTQDDTNPDKAHNSRNSIDYEGSYKALLPCNKCKGIKTKLRLSSDHFTLTTEHMGKCKDNATKTMGQFHWEDDGKTIVLDTKEIPNMLLVEEGNLICLDKSGEIVRGEFANRYIFHRGN